MVFVDIRIFFVVILALSSGISSLKNAPCCLDDKSATSAECEDAQTNVTFKTRLYKEQQAMLRMIKAYVSSSSHFSDLPRVWDDVKLALKVSLPYAKATRFAQMNGTATTTAEEKEERAAMSRVMRAYVYSKSKSSDAEQVVDDIKLIFDEALGDKDEVTSKPALKASTTEYFADRHIRGAMEVISDPDCMSREFDVTADEYDSEEARTVFKKCKLLVLRNVFAVDFMREFTNNFTEFINAVNTGSVGRKGRSTNGDSVFWQDLDHGKWEILLPRNLAHVDLHARKTVIEILSDTDILGDEIALHSSGAIFSESGSSYQAWHIDNPYIFNGDTSFSRYGVAGHDLPSYAVGTLTPMLNMTYSHGPTEFCMGSSHLLGVMSKLPKVKNESLVGPASVYMEYKKAAMHGGCPPRFWRSPLVKFGDLVLFDYKLTHRAGMNVSPDLRALFYMTYSRRWFKDSSFQVEKDEDIDSIDELKAELRDLDSSDDGSSDDDSSDDKDDLKGNALQRGLERCREVPDELDAASGDPRKEELLLSFILRSARLAVPDYDEVEAEDKDEVNAKDTESYVKLEDMKWFDSEIDNEKRSQHLEYKAEKLLVSNANIQIGGLAIYTDEVRVGEFKCGESIHLTAKPGQKIEIRSADGFVYKSWPILPGTAPRQLVASTNNIKVPDP